MAFIYHYCGFIHREDGGGTHVDGVLTAERKVDSYERYQEVKKAIAKEDLDPSKLVISSLTLLHEDLIHKDGEGNEVKFKE